MGIFFTTYLAMVLTGTFPYAYEEVSYQYYAATEETSLYGDEDGIWVPLPFTFHYDNHDFDSVFITTNGYITFTSNLVSPQSQNFPDSAFPNGVIAPLWNDFVLYSGGHVNTGVYGTSPNRYFVIEWDSIYLYGGNPDERYKFEVVLYENGTDGDSILVSFYGIPSSDSGFGAVCGIESLDGKGGVVYSYNGAPNPIAQGKSVVFHRVPVQNDCAALGILEPSSTRGTGEEIVPLGGIQNYTSTQATRYVHFIIKDHYNNLLYHDSTEISIAGDTFSFVSFSPLTLPNDTGMLKLSLYLSPEDDYPQNDTAWDTTYVLKNCDTFPHYILWDMGTCDLIDISQSYDKKIAPGTDGGATCSLPFVFPFYDTTYTSVYVGINGGISLNKDTVDYYNYPLSSMGDEDFIGVFWDNWAGSSDTSSTDSVIYVKSFGSDSVVFMWKGMKKEYYTAGPIDFEAVLYPSGDIKCLYNIAMNYWYEQYDVTVGIHSRDSDYVQYTFNEDPWVPDWWYPHGIYFKKQETGIYEKKVEKEAFVPLKSGINNLLYDMKDHIGKLEIYDAQGRRMGRYVLRKRGIISLRHLRRGVYFAVLRTDGKIYKKKVIVIK